MGLTTLFVLRHGETDYNSAARIQGQVDSRLSERGHEQARRAGLALSSVQPNAIVSSDLSRAVDTARYLADETGVRATSDPRLREIRLGAWEGLTFSELEKDNPGAIAQWRNQLSGRAPQGESWYELADRVTAVVADLDESLRDHPDATAVLVSHGGASLTLVTRLIGLPDSRWPALGHLGNCCWAELVRPAADALWRLAAYNCPDADRWPAPAVATSETAPFVP